MFEDLKDYRIILVSGPQRSGTRFVARAIAHDTGHNYVDEVGVHTDSVYGLDWIMQEARVLETSVVVQCPALMWVIPFIADAPDILVVVCMRKEEEIVASEERIGWSHEWIERLRYQFHQDAWPICRIKYAAWGANKWRVPNYREVCYEEMEGHPLWVPKKRRKNFLFDQTEE